MLDSNQQFGQVGILDPPQTQAINPVTNVDYKIEIVDPIINKISVYNIIFKTSIMLLKGSHILISFENTQLQILQDSQFSVITGLTGSPQFQMLSNKLIKITNYDNVALNVQIKIQITKVLNPSSKGNTNNVIVTTWLDGAFTILEKLIYDAELLIQAGTLTQLKVGAFKQYYNENNQYPFVENDIVQHEVDFILANPIPETGSIVINYFIESIIDANTKFQMRVILGLEDQSQDKKVLIVKDGTSIKISQFKQVSDQKLIRVSFEINNGALASYSNFSIKTYFTLNQSFLIDQAITGLNLAINKAKLDGTSSISQSNNIVGQANDITFTIDQDIQINQFFYIWIPLGFTYNNNYISTNCNFAAPVQSYSVLQFKATSTCTTNGIKLLIKVKNNNIPYKYYPFGVSLVDTSNIIQVKKKKKKLNKKKQKHSTIGLIELIYSTGSTFQVIQQSQDCQMDSITKIKFTPNKDIPQSVWVQDYTQVSSRILLKFPVLNASLQQIYKIDLAVNNPKDIPCYGRAGISPYDTEILCQLIQNGSDQNNPTIVQITNYKQIASLTPVELHFPDFQNPSSTLTQPTIEIEIYATILRQEYQILKESFNIPICNASIAVQVSNNNAPIFNPAYVNEESKTSIFYNFNKQLDSGDYIVFAFPQLQITNPMEYILPINGLKCYIGVGNASAKTCYTYPKSGWLFFEVDQTFTPGIIYTFYITGIKNPTFASDFQGTMKLLSFKNKMVIETGLFNSFTQFRYGTLKTSKVTTQKYESLRTDVSYDWLFQFQNNIPENGRIDLIFPKNYYDLSRDLNDNNIPKPKIQIFYGIESNDSLPLTDKSHFEIAVNTYTIKGVKAIQKETLIYLRINHVKNPPIEGITNFFEIMSKNQEGLTIDYNRNIRTLIIKRKLPVGIIKFKQFIVNPDNGNPNTVDSQIVFCNDALNPTNSFNYDEKYTQNFPGTYTIQFYPNYDIQPLGIIYLQFPNDFTKEYFYDYPNIRCYVSGAMKTFKSCKLDESGNLANQESLAVVKIILDDYLYVEDGMEPVIISIKNVKNISPELNSGVVVVKTEYDQVILDESGSTNENRKVITGVAARTLYIHSFNYYPRNEGQSSTYIIDLVPNEQLNESSKIIFSFSYEYSRNLGTNISCMYKDLQKDTYYYPITCIEKDWTITITNIQNMDQNDILKCKIISIKLINIINPYTNNNVLPPIKCFIMKNNNAAYRYISNVIPQDSRLNLSSAPDILFMKQLRITNNNIRELSDYKFSLTTSQPIQFYHTYIQFQDGYDLENLWLTPRQLTHNSITNIADLSLSVILNEIFIQSKYKIQYNIPQDIEILMEKIPNPYDPGVQPGYPIVSLYNTDSFTIKQMTFNNLNNFLTPDFIQKGKIVTIGTDIRQLNIQKGVWSKSIIAQIQNTESSEIKITPICSNNLVKFQPIIISPGKQETKFQIGVSNQIQVQKIFITFKIDFSGYIQVRPFYLYFDKNQNVLINIDPIRTVTSGGRSKPIKVELDNSPYDVLNVNISILGNDPKYISVYPSQIQFSDSAFISYFWVSVDRNTEGIQGKVLFYLTGNGTDDEQKEFIKIFKFQNRVQTFLIVKPENTKPFIFQFSKENTFEGLKFDIQVSKPSTIYYFVSSIHSPRLPIETIRQKKMTQDYYGASFLMGEFISTDSTNRYIFELKGLKQDFDYTAHIYVEDYSGNYSEDELTFDGRTLGKSQLGDADVSQIQFEWLDSEIEMGKIQSNYAFIQNIGLKFSGVVHAIVVRKYRRIFPNTSEAVPGSIRYLDDLGIQPFSKRFLGQVSSNTHICKTSDLNQLSIICDIVANPPPDISRNDDLEQNEPQTPYPSQIYAGLDDQNLNPNYKTKEYFPVQIFIYFIFIIFYHSLILIGLYNYKIFNLKQNMWYI
ncbi:hypothetical protein IMG5_131340 [Ichthyophthirius multifiliis]|uniref:Uncharacterized protein n=1 Tax=Ichthyophthirius multifiliis TaxID=5932 RepID=G0QWE3_ICHMU|nr:hypothetical protein IMG5_131340 [Ichthyophthirius multifiliis]EGR30460.1 hypothetical protein IMG5_131340 [Ichthyophthirius multifiliis]|eukprot:XP_004032047.1 hypothetical protein IMG5_131340 [Ichthyophthirius multifiliis]